MKRDGGISDGGISDRRTSNAVTSGARMLTVVGVVYAIGCAGAASGPTVPGDGGPVADDTVTPNRDSGIEPPSPEAASGLAYDDRGLSRTDIGAGATDAAETRQCNEALAGRGALEIDCAETGCENIASCCVGRGDCCGDGTNLAPPSLAGFSGCGTDVLGCLGDTTGAVFGSPSPTITADGTFAPGGNGDFDSGLVLDPAVDLRSTRLELTAHFVVPSDCGPGCLEGAAVSVSTQDVFDSTTHVDMLAGLVMSGSRNEVALVVAGREVEHWPVATAAAWRLRLTPDGLVQVIGDTTTLLTSPVGYVPAGAARIVLSGHDLNPAPDHRVAGLSSLDIAATRCDIPTGWGARESFVLREHGGGGTIDPPVSALSLVVDDSGVWHAALVIDNQLFLAQRPGTIPSELTLTGALDNPVFDPEPGNVLGSPAFYASPENTSPIVLMPVATADGTFLMRASVTTPTITGADFTTLLAPDTEIAAYDSVTLARVNATHVAMIVRRTQRDGSIDYGVYDASSDVTSLMELPGLHLNDALAASAAPGFDADEVAGLALVGQDHAWQLYYARRQGARWSIGLLVSDDLVYFRHAADGDSVLLSDGSARESVGVRGPSVVFDDERVTLSYIGLDGSVSWPRFTTRRATSEAVWLR